MSASNLTDDLDYLRTLAEAGETAPLLGGRFLSWWGGVMSLAYFAHYGIGSGLFGLSLNALGIMWMTTMVVAGIGYALLCVAMPANKPGAGSVGNRLEQQIWKAVGFVLFVVFAALILKAIKTGSAANVGFDWSLPLVFALYSVALSVSGYMAQNRILQIAGYGAMVSSGVAIFMIGTAELYLAASLAVLLTVFLPGLLMLRAEPSETV